MEISVRQKVVTCITGFWCVILVVLVLGHNVNADEKYSNIANKPPETKLDSSVNDANDPNELWWRRYDTVVKDPNNANELLEAKWNAVVTVLQNKDLNQKRKEKIIDKIISPIFDTELMAKLALGRTNWPKLTVPQQKRFTKLFSERLKSFYQEKTTFYTDEKVLFKPAKQEKNNIIIPMVLISDNTEDEILYKLHKMDKSWKIYDVEIQGVSILQTYRAQFDDILRRGTVKDLLSELEKPPAQ